MIGADRSRALLFIEAIEYDLVFAVQFQLFGPVSFVRCDDLFEFHDSPLGLYIAGEAFRTFVRRIDCR